MAAASMPVPLASHQPPRPGAQAAQWLPSGPPRTSDHADVGQGGAARRVRPTRHVLPRLAEVGSTAVLRAQKVVGLAAAIALEAPEAVGAAGQVQMLMWEAAGQVQIMMWEAAGQVQMLMSGVQHGECRQWRA
jgi:hypothetical protein